MFSIHPLQKKHMDNYINMLYTKWNEFFYPHHANDNNFNEYLKLSPVDEVIEQMDNFFWFPFLGKWVYVWQTKWCFCFPVIILIFVPYFGGSCETFSNEGWFPHRIVNMILHKHLDETRFNNSFNYGTTARTNLNLSDCVNAPKDQVNVLSESDDLLFRPIGISMQVDGTAFQRHPMHSASFRRNIGLDFSWTVVPIVWWCGGFKKMDNGFLKYSKMKLGFQISAWREPPCSWELGESRHWHFNANEGKYVVRKEMVGRISVKCSNTEL